MRKYWGILVLIVWAGQTTAQVNTEAVNAFAREVSEKNGLGLSEVKGILDKATYQPEIIGKMNRPAEGMPWHKYRNIFMKQDRIDAGVEFRKTHQRELSAISLETGVSEEIILGILGVETYFGQRKGTYKVLDALYTLAFAYPKRARFFKSELEHFLLLVDEENLVVDEVLGSYAGAIGYCQFMPSSYRAYAKSYEAGGTRDLVNSAEDAMASVANYLKVHKWKEGQKVACLANQTSGAQELKKQSLKPKNTVSYYTKLGYRPDENISPSSISTLIQLEQIDNKEYWFGFNNFYVITRYNHSELYAMAVFQLATAIAEQAEN